MIDDERFTQDSIDGLPPIEPSAQIRRMVAELPLKHPQTVRSLWPFANVWMPTLSMAAVALLGLFVGQGLSGVDHSQTSLTNNSDEVLALDIDVAKEAEIDELLILATAGDFAADDWDLSHDPEMSNPEEGTF